MSEFKDKVEVIKDAMQEAVHDSSEHEGQERYSVPEDDVETSESVEAEAHEGPAQTHRQRKRNDPNSFKNRVNYLIKQREEEAQRGLFYQQQAIDLAQQASSKDDVIRSLHQQLQLKDKAIDVNIDANFSAQEDDVKYRLKSAKELGDIDQEIDLTDQLAELKANRSTYEAWKSQNAQQPQHIPDVDDYVPNERPLPVYDMAPRYSEPVNEDYRDWVETNRWYETNPKLRQEADHIASELENIMHFNGQADLVGTYEFMEEVSNEMQRRYGVARQEPAPQQQHYPQSAPAVAPVTRRGTSMADQYIARSGNGSNSRKVTLSPEQYAIARNLKIPMGNGQYISGDQAAQKYKDYQNYPASPHGGSPYRLTILD